MTTSHYHCTYCNCEIDDPRQSAVRCPSCGRTNHGEAAVDTLQDETKATEADYDDTHENLGIDDVVLPGMEIEEELGSGGFGSVYRARQRQFGRDVAVKILHRSHVDNDEDRFLSEAIITGNLQHPNIIPVHDLGKDNHGRQYFTMKIADGDLLSNIIDGLSQGDQYFIEQYDLHKILDVFLDICDAVAFAHDKGVIHRDLKPQNIIVGDFGETYVLDWGLAKVQEKKETQSEMIRITALAKAQMGVSNSLTLEGSVMGTPGYMSPEQANGASNELSLQTDVYSLGVILFELMCFKI
ncbi:MAG: serine/threonine protein kinase, partial [Planctomycetes bacterium]|nr:serine/threonine protein kinase [Planctomycetota bacterium]